jgi:type I restriction enzyme M protein
MVNLNNDFEKKIWDSIYNYKGSMDASQYKPIVLGLIFLKYVSDKFEEKYQELIDEGEGFEEDKDFYEAENIFYVPPKARWNVISEHAHKKDNGITIDNAMRLIEKENNTLKDVLPKIFSSNDLDKQKLGAVIDIFTNIKMANKGDKKDIFGRTYEYCLRKFAEEEGNNGSKLYTPSSIAKTIVEILEPYEGRIYDPCCGSGGMFVQSQKFIENRKGNINNISIYGQESNSTTWKIAKMNLAIRTIEANLGKHNADTFLNDLHPTLKADYIMANPPSNSEWEKKQLEEDQRWKYGIPSKGNANFAWIQHMIYHLTSNGKIGLVLANGSLTSRTNNEDKIRQAIIEDDLVEGIIALPNNLINNMSACLWFLTKKKKQKGKTLFIDARELGTMVSRKLRELTEEDIQQLAQTYHQYQEGTLEEEKGYSKIATLDDIKEQGYNLTPGRYVGFKPEEDDGIPFEEKMKTLTTELKKLFEESHKQEEEIRKILKELCCDI